MTTDIPKGYKKTEVGVIPEDWQVKKLGGLCEMTSSKRIFESEYVPDGVPFYRGKEISLLIENQPIEDEYFISERKYDEIRREFGAPQKDDILITAVGTLGNVYVVPDSQKFYFKDGNLIWLRKIKGIDVPYLAIQIRRSKTSIINNAIGSSQKALTIIVLREQDIPVPTSEDEQIAIATALSDTDRLIAVTEKLITKKRNIKQGAMQELLTGKRHLPGFSGKWEAKTLGEILAYEQPTNYLVKSTEYNDNNEIAVLTANKSFVLGYTDETFGVFDSVPAIIFDDFTTASKFVDFPFKVKSSALKILKLRSRAFDIRFMFEKMQLIQFSLGDHKRYWISEYQHISVEVPKIDEQVAIARALSDMNTEIDQLEQKLAKYRMIKQGMMQELLTGKTRVI